MFHSDYHSTRWTPGRVITWSLVNYPDVLYLPYTNIYVDVALLQKTSQINLVRQAFNLWDSALSSITFQETTMGNDADVAVGIVDGGITTWGRWHMTWNNKINNNAAIRIMNHLNDNQFLTTILHEIGNVLGLGDMYPNSYIQSIQEDLDSFPEYFPVDASNLWPFDKQMIQYLYGESPILPVIPSEP